ncbi:A/G-specific adenine glycosylase [Novosphingobium mangrovi (ex Huang et al. 2023)]|uniref:Adenine DNA glycosylase n=1 Tax=Novosphingobium mangrovi (ex Huang et al. 2023) TaxID=2976432 RepID=A0ABT2I0B6_9SPHN|nr:A/G-specific adenine glycosylase [Novosphingobium mangrovi (ex Huang et al. 2023)]MCT2398244.1 A/G-specific adenine glycosylase [Novosphingobium mangrovi (ex Huang et al. 2023)]
MDASFDAVSRALLDWYDAHARDLPWRARPGTPPPEPYRVWLSEVMLQQTTVAAVKDYFAAFTSRWPSVEALAVASDEDVMAAWAGLGYYARARNLLACAREVAANGGRFPDTEEGLRALPGLGAYTAAAVAAIAFERRAVVVDANVERVVARLFALDEPLPGGRTAIRERADAITPQARSGDFAQAMMDLGATVCTSRAPRCLLCPLASHCTAQAMGEPERFPVKAPKKAKPARRGRAFWIERDEHVWLVRRPGKGMLGGMRALPDDGWNARADGSGDGPLAGPWESAGKVGHVFTHFSLELNLTVYLGDQCDSLARHEGEWWPLEQLDAAGLPTLFAKAARLALAGTGEEA